MSGSPRFLLCSGVVLCLVFAIVGTTPCLALPGGSSDAALSPAADDGTWARFVAAGMPPECGGGRGHRGEILEGILAPELV